MAAFQTPPWGVGNIIRNSWAPTGRLVALPTIILKAHQNVTMTISKSYDQLSNHKEMLNFVLLKRNTNKSLMAFI